MLVDLPSYQSMLYFVFPIALAFIERIAEIGVFLGNGGTREVQALRKFGKHFGIGHQIMNDVADFVPSSYGITTTTKTIEDSYSDVRNGYLTLPIIYVIWNYVLQNNKTS